MSKILRYALGGLLLHSAVGLAAPTGDCEEALFTGVDTQSGKIVSVCKKGEYIDFFFGEKEKESEALHFDTPIEQTGWGEDINYSGDTHTVFTMLNGIEQYGVYFDNHGGKKEGGIIFYDCEGGRDFIDLDNATLTSKLGPRLSDIGVAITNDF